MAVEAHHLHHFFSPQLLTKREVIGNIENQTNIYNNMNMNFGYIAPPQQQQQPQQFSAGIATAGGSFQIPLASVAAASESGLTFNNNLPNVGNTMCRKRLRTDDVSSHIHQQLLDVDRLILQHTEKVRIEMMERGKRFLKQVIIGVEQNVAKRLKAKDEEIERISKLNWALEERIKSLCLESQIWRDMAQNNEATANMLRINLEQALAAAQMRANVDENCNSNGGNEDAESCCCGEVKEENNEEEKKVVEWAKSCKGCEQREPSVLMLPCRHLSLCVACGPMVDICPVCSCTKTGTVHINLS